MKIEEFNHEDESILGIPIYTDGLFNTIEGYAPVAGISIKTILTKEQFEQNSYKA